MVNATPGRFTPGKETWYPLYRRLGGPQGWSGRVWKISPPTEIRSPNRPARSKSLYRLSYPGPSLKTVDITKFVRYMQIAHIKKIPYCDKMTIVLKINIKMIKLHIITNIQKSITYS